MILETNTNKAKLIDEVLNLVAYTFFHAGAYYSKLIMPERSTEQPHSKTINGFVTVDTIYTSEKKSCKLKSLSRNLGRKCWLIFQFSK